jgi:hypothetical protein
MILGWLRLAFFGLIGLTIIYFIVGIYSRSVRREKLEKQWVAEALEGDREAFIEQGMKDYEQGLKKRLLWLIYIIPMVAFTVIITYVNW